jgi:myo-inositol-1(or 4)-monophosphatase
MNFVHGVPYVAISIGFTVNRSPTIGVVLNPFTAQLYAGILTRGSYLTTLTSDLLTPISTARLPLYPAQKLDLQSSVLAIEYGSDRHGHNFSVKLNTFKNLSAQNRGMVHGLRAYGSAALNLCSVASGFLDAYWEGGCWEWDVCAGWVVLKEAGGFVVGGNPSGEEVLEEPDLCGRVYLGVRRGSNVPETAEFVRQFWGMIDGRLEYGR